MTGTCTLSCILVVLSAKASYVSHGTCPHVGNAIGPGLDEKDTSSSLAESQMHVERSYLYKYGTSTDRITYVYDRTIPAAIVSRRFNSLCMPIVRVRIDPTTESTTAVMRHCTDKFLGLSTCLCKFLGFGRAHFARVLLY